jgi:hypothetical protein
MMGHSPEIAQKHYPVLDWQPARESVDTLRQRPAEVVSIWSHQPDKQKRQA